METFHFQIYRYIRTQETRVLIIIAHLHKQKADFERKQKYSSDM